MCHKHDFFPNHECPTLCLFSHSQTQYYYNTLQAYKCNVNNIKYSYCTVYVCICMYRYIYLYIFLNFCFSFRSRVTASHNQLICSLCSAHCSVYSKLGMVERLITYIVNAIIYLMHLLYANLYFIPFVYILSNAL